MLVDRYHVTVPILVSAIGQVIAAFVLWGLTNGQPMLYVFALAWGMFGGGFSATWSGYAATLQQKHPNVHHDTGLILAMMAAGRGIGAVISGPMSESLLGSGWRSDAGFAYGTNYGILIVFAGVSAVFSAIACIGRPLKLI